MSPPSLLRAGDLPIDHTHFNEYRFHIYSVDDMSLLKDLETYFPDGHQEVVQEYNRLSAHLIGQFTYAGISFYVTRDPVNTGFQGYQYYIYSFRSRKDYKQLKERLTDLESDKAEQADKDHAIYRFVESKYQRKETFKPLKIDFLIGRDQIYQNIIEQMQTHTAQAKFLQSVGESGRSINLLFYGPPGTGKSSMVLILATTLQLPIYVVNPSSLRPDLVQAALSPQGGSKGMKLLLYDDIDRYLATQGTNLMSQILNSLDGLDDDGNVVRIFSANDETILQRIPALMSRFTATYKFDIPDRCMFAKKVDKLMQCYGPDWQQKMNMHRELEQLCEKARIHGLSFRVFTNYLIRFLFPPSYLEEEQKKVYNPLQTCLQSTTWNEMIELQATSHLNSIKETEEEQETKEIQMLDDDDSSEDGDYMDDS